MVTLNGSPDLSGFDANTWILFLDTSSSRKFFDLSAADNVLKTVTCVNAPIGTSTGLTWGIGGKRATIGNADSVILFSTDWKIGWIVDIEDNQSISAAMTLAATGTGSSGPATLRGPSAKITITQTANTNHFTLSTMYLRMENIILANSNATKTSAHAINCTSAVAGLVAKNCVFGTSTSKVRRGFNGASAAYTSAFCFNDCLFDTCDAEGIYFDTTGSGDLHIFGCDFRACCASTGSASVYFLSAGTLSMEYSSIAAGVAAGIQFATRVPFSIRIVGNTIHGNTGASSDGIYYNLTTSQMGTIIANNNITANGRYGINGHATLDANKGFIDYNNFGTGATANTSGDMNLITDGANDLAVDPSYTDAANKDFSVGTSVKAEGFPDAARKAGSNPSTGSVWYVDIGVQRQEAAASTTVVVSQRRPIVIVTRQAYIRRQTTITDTFQNYVPIETRRKRSITVVPQVKQRFLPIPGATIETVVPIPMPARMRYLQPQIVRKRVANEALFSSVTQSIVVSSHRKVR